MKKKKILMICDTPLAFSGVGIQAMYLIRGLLTTGKYQFRVLGGAIKHSDYAVRNIFGEIAKPEDDCIIKPIDGFGDVNLLRVLLATEKPDALVLFTDPRFFPHVWEIEDEIHQICPIFYNYLWDNDPFPNYNKPMFDCVDQFNCISHHTFKRMSEHYPDKAQYTPHGVPQELFKPLPDDVIKEAKIKLFGPDNLDKFYALWVGRNARRKNPGDILHAWSEFIKKLEDTYGHRRAMLVMRTDPRDQEGPNLIEIAKLFKIEDCVNFINQYVSMEDVAVIHNIVDMSLNISNNEGFGCPINESLMCGKPVIVQKTGGLEAQVINQIDGSINGIVLEPDVRTIVGNNFGIPYIYEDFVSHKKLADAIFEMYEWGPEKRKEVGMKAREYCLDWFDIMKTVKKWDESFEKVCSTWKEKYKRWENIEI